MYSLSESIKNQIMYSRKQPEIIKFYTKIHNNLTSTIGDINLERYCQNEIEIPNDFGGFWILKINDRRDPDWNDLDNQIREILKNQS